MGFMDKLKNIFFEEEEEDEEINESLPPKVEKEVIARKVEIPKRVKEEIDYEKVQSSIKKEIVKEQPKEFVEIKKEVSKVNNDLIFEDDDFILEVPNQIKKEKPKEEDLYSKKTENNIYKSRENRDLYKNSESIIKKETPKYEYQSDVSQKEPKTFTPSPIISPIYGILDKNYKKEEVKERKEIRISSRPVKMDLDSVRNKAFGDLENDVLANTINEEVEEKEILVSKNREIKKIYDMSKDKTPSIEKVTIGEADEYFNDLGLAYNTDYKDISKELNDGRIPDDEKKDKSDRLEDNLFDLIESMYDRED